jgi:GNAT superfamily N-acetyltransferase
MEFSTPRLLKPDDNLSDFECSEISLNFWLRNSAQKNNKSGASKTFVTFCENQLAGYYCLSAASIAHLQSPKSLTRNMPDPLPCVLLGRLAIDEKFKGIGVGSALLKDAMMRVVSVSQLTGVVGLITHPLNENAKSFYLKYGFIECPGADATLILPIKTIAKSIS